MLTIKESSPKLIVNVEEILKAGGASKVLLSHLESPQGSYVEDAIKFEYLGEEVSISPVHELDQFYHDLYVKGSKSHKVSQHVVEALANLAVAQGLAPEDLGGVVSNASDQAAVANSKDPEMAFFDTGNSLFPPKLKPDVAKDLNAPALALFDIVPGTSETNYRAIYRDTQIMMSCRLNGDNKGGVVRLDFLEGNHLNDLDRDHLKTFGFSFKTGSNSEGTYVDYASSHISINPDDVITMTDYIWIIASRLRLRVSTQIHPGNLACMVKAHA